MSGTLKGPTTLSAPMSLFADNAGSSLIVHSHLRWDFVWQRPQQLLSRLSARAPVLFVEEPMHPKELAQPRLDVSTPLPNVYRVVPMLPASLRGKYDASILLVRDLLGRLIGDGTPLGELFARPIHWFYTPMPAPAMIGGFNEIGIVYDCMDELSKFRFAPSELVDREAYLLAEADVVFAGGYRLAESKARRHRNVHFFGCGVDLAHFGTARDGDTLVHEALAPLNAPVAGYYGVIDERIDYPLLAALAALLPDVAVVMVGPVVKVDPRVLPQAPNIHWLGQRNYAELPALVKGFDVCLMPFALNESTEYINPTKTLEYMAAGKPIVSTAIADVVHHFTPVVAVADDIGAFVAAVRDGIERPNATLITHGVEQARQNSWDSIVARMQRVMDRALTPRTGWRTADKSVARDVFAARRTTERATVPVQDDAVA
jgi:glycosyltransferase involved in cell wall biosynthesis